MNLVRMTALAIAVAFHMNPSFAGSRQAHLWCVPGFDRGTEERRVEDGNFSVKLVSYWDREPNVVDFMRGQECIGQMVKHKAYRFMGTGKTQWLAVEYMVLADGAKPSRNIATWVDAHVLLQGKVQLHAPDGIVYEQKSMARVPEADDGFMKKHRAEQMSSHVGSITIDGKWHRFFIVCLNRGKESWKIVKVFPVHPKDGASDDEAAKVERSDLMIAGLFIGNFKVLGGRLSKAAGGGLEAHGLSLGDQSLIEAVKEGDQIKVGEILSKGADPNCKGARNVTPLGAFVSLPNMEEKLPVLKLLLEKGADPNMVWGDCGTTPFYYLVQRGIYGKVEKILPAVRLMLEHGADPNRKQGFFGLTPFGYATTRTSSPDMELVRTIVEHGGIVTQKMVDAVKDEKVKAYLRSRLNAKGE